MISPEAASSILWRDATKAQEPHQLKITAQDMLRFGVIDQILKEPPGGAHRDAAAMITATGDAIAQAFNDLRNLDADAVASSGGRSSSISGASSVSGLLYRGSCRDHKSYPVLIFF